MERCATPVRPCASPSASIDAAPDAPADETSREFLGDLIERLREFAVSLREGEQPTSS